MIDIDESVDDDTSSYYWWHTRDKGDVDPWFWSRRVWLMLWR